jgi:hypothetical protein
MSSLPKTLIYTWNVSVTMVVGLTLAGSGLTKVT